MSVETINDATENKRGLEMKKKHTAAGNAYRKFCRENGKSIKILEDKLSIGLGNGEIRMGSEIHLGLCNEINRLERLYLSHPGHQEYMRVIMGH